MSSEKLLIRLQQEVNYYEIYFVVNIAAIAARYITATAVHWSWEQNIHRKRLAMRTAVSKFRAGIGFIAVNAFVISTGPLSCWHKAFRKLQHRYWNGFCIRYNARVNFVKLCKYSQNAEFSKQKHRCLLSCTMTATDGSRPKLMTFTGLVQLMLNRFFWVSSRFYHRTR